MPVGQPISKKVARQIKAREEILGKTHRSPQDLTWMTSRNVFVRLLSSVNILSDEEAQRIYETRDISAAKGDPTYAKNRVLYSLGLAADSSRDQFTQNQTIGAPNPAMDLRKNTSLGVRPGTGITNMTVKSKNTYGTLREAEISLKIWSKEELEDIEKLYFRPGYTVLLEWGHTYYYLSDTKQYNAEILTVTDFFKNGNSFEDIEGKIDNLRVKSDYNYDGMMGYCSNFSWSLNSDGSYDATIKVISRGAIIESLSSNADPLSHISAEYLAEPDEEEGKKQRKSIFHFILNAMEKYALDGTSGFSPGLISRKGLVERIPELDKLLPNEETLGTRALQDLADTGWIFEDTINMQWISLKTFCHIVNKAIMPHSGDGRTMAQMNTMYDEERMAIAVKENKPPDSVVRTLYVTHPAHFSVDPYVCFLPIIPLDEKIAKESVVNLYDTLDGFAAAWSTVKNAAIDLWDWVTGNNTVEMEGVQPWMVDNIASNRGKIFAKYGTSSITPNNPLDICVSNYYLYEVLDSIYDQKDGDKSLFAIFEAILSGINDALGGINELDLYFSEDDNRYYIIDRKSSLPGVVPPTIQVSGLGTSITDLQISSKISNEMASMISIASQATRPNSQEDIHALMTWNRGKIDRLMPSKSQESEEKAQEKGDDLKKTKQKEFENWMSDLDDTFGHFCNRWGRNQKYRKSDHEALKSYHKSFNAEALEMATTAQGDPPVGVIPLELSLKMEGIAGLKIAESFNIDTAVLPSAYEKFSYIITGLDHGIENGRWVTNIKTQFYISKKPTPSEISQATKFTELYQLMEDSNYNNSGGSGGSDAGWVPGEKGKMLKGDNVSYDGIKKAVQEHNYKWFEDAYVLNIVGIRNYDKYKKTAKGVDIPGTNRFDDLMVVAWKDDKGDKFAESFNVSTDPGFQWLAKGYTPKNSTKNIGSAILKEGQYINSHKIGYHMRDLSHKNRHPALVQTGDVTVYRDANFDKIYNLITGTEMTGNFGINIHKGTYNGVGTVVGLFSAGCQVFKREDNQRRLMDLCNTQVKQAKKSKFTYTLINTLNKQVQSMDIV